MHIKNKNKNKNNYERTIFGEDGLTNKNVDILIQMKGFILYFLIFVIIIPYLLIKYNKTELLEVYIPNFDLIAVTLGYGGGPFSAGIFKYLYNPEPSTLYGFISSQIINYLSLLGLTYIVAFYAVKERNIYKGWSRAFFMLILTYLLPGNFIAELMSYFGKFLDKTVLLPSTLHWLIVYGFSIIMILILLFLEFILIKNYSNKLALFLQNFKI